MEADHLYELIKSSLPVGLSVVDKNRIIVDFNAAAERITGYSREEVIGRPYVSVLHDGAGTEDCPLIRHAFEQREQAVATETNLRRKSGEMIVVSSTISPIYDKEGIFIGGIELFTDITGAKRAERERKNILSMFAHDMKNPVLAVGGFLARLLAGKAGPLTDMQRQHLDLIAEELSRLEELITDFLEFSKFEKQEYRPELKPFNIEMGVYRHIETARVIAEKKNITIVFELPDDFSPLILADAMLVDRVVANLLDNAIKYTNPGGLVILKVFESGEEIQVQVCDTGIGIPEDRLPYIFDAFYRIHRDTKGSGLGLTIAKMIVNAHGGRIWVESVPGRGSVFHFTLPKH